ncbi:PspA/IM30 family protein [Caulobacter hibisci]|uniref:PspA/IM30 family protein n=1 Tax=Caulobacter hibisci TaxID=2035993 RepID=A0ABS0SYJ5_9CAUL|nr:PspA/IM30 family protein [Caulobacter hibisci]MBI1684695.1 PspA/IM30 family protein [Caulobacter hibisci]
MADSLRARVGRIVSGGAHALIDALEDVMPDALGQQALREVDQAVDEVRAELGRAIAARHLAAKRLTEQSSRHDDLSAQIELALSQDREDLIRAALEHQLDIEAQVPVLETAVADAAQRQAELEGYLAALQATRREMAEDLTDLSAARSKAPKPPTDVELSQGAKLSELERLARRHRVEERLAALRAARQED